MQVVPILIMTAGSIFILKGQLTIPSLLTFLLYAGNITTSVEIFVKLLVQYNEGLAGFNWFYDLMQQTPSITDEAVIELTQIDSLAFEQVYFKYENQWVLENISFKVDKGEYIAIMGPSGAGKSTIANLIPRFYEVSQGTININGIPLSDYSIVSLQSKIGLVQQDVCSYSTSAYENIKLAKPNATQEEIIQAAKLANADEYISKLPDGYQTILDEKGAKLSGGQKQRISIAIMLL